MKIVKQHDEKDCGAACMSIIATHFGLVQPIQKYRELTKTDRNGCNIYGIIDAAHQIGLQSEAFSGSMDELVASIENGEIKLPLIAHIITKDAFLHFIVIEKFQNDKFYIIDPAIGRQKFTIEKFASFWSGYIITFEKTPNFKKGDYKKHSFTKFFSLLKGQHKFLILTLISSIIISSIGIAGAFVFEIVVNNFEETHSESSIEDTAEGGMHFSEKITEIIHNDPPKLHYFFIGLIGLYILQASIQYIRGNAISVLSKNIDLKLLIPYYNKIMDLPVNTLNTRNTGEYLSRFSDASNIRIAISGATLTLILDSAMAVVCGIMLYKENSALFFINLITIIVYAIVVLCYKKPIEKSNRNVMINNAIVQSYLKESIDGIETLKTNCAENIAKEQNANKFLKLINHIFKNSVMQNSQDSICDAVELVGNTVVLWIGFSMTIKGTISLGSLLTFYALLAYFTSPIKNLIELQPTMQTAVVAAERINDILDAEAEENHLKNKKTLSHIDNIKIQNLNFRYGNRELILDNISMNINKGEKIAFVGESGSGKTTISKLIMQFYTPEKGSITINDVNISNYNIDSLRSKIAYVSQNTFLFSDTIKNNLCIAKNNASNDEILAALKISDAYNFVENLSFGLNTFLDENGLNLSGGQRQRLSIARAMLRKPELLILDEATSNLDSATENKIKENIYSAFPNLTCVFIAHRLSVISDCDRIYFFENGKIVESGSHESLMQIKGKYYSQWQIQCGNN